ncbi:MAG: NADH-quinone oxidoreductase subunit G [Gammaproteobacteria bacterium]|nr:MAG: NADH-quinone oxidoreductase subunit G [Gammaproteobacteria bacterium]
MSDEMITIEVDGRQLKARPGQMLIEVTDAAGITVPRFCYHKHLSVAANCRMCLVEVEKAPKPLPACATPCTDGMKVFTRSPLARAAQKGTMEFLLINHPLDCPICDQGGECELQDVAMGFGGDVSRYSESKRVVRDEDIGPLVATDMTRCIHCTRCVRFGGEIAGLRELGATGRGEHMRIGVFVEHSIGSELSGNIIDLCPVGALTSKPFRFKARAWELVQRDSIAPHDGVGSNVHLHLRRNRLMRVVPKENEGVNQTWLSDRDRFSYEGLYAGDRLTTPMLRENGKLRPAEWDEALETAARLLKGTAAERLGTLVSPSATLEEMYLAAQLTRGLGSDNIDHRLRQCDFRDDAIDPPLPWLGRRFADIAANEATLLVGSWLRKDQPLLNHRVRESWKNGGAVLSINPVDFDVNYPLEVDVVCTPAEMVTELAGVAAALGAPTEGVEVTPDQAHQAAAEILRGAGRGSVMLGTLAMMHPDFSLLRRLAANIAEAAGLDWGTVGFGANDTGAWLAGAVPHRRADGGEAKGANTRAMLEGGCDTLLILGAEPEFDFAEPAAAGRAVEAAQVVALATHLSSALERGADVILPIAAFAETSGSYVNLQGDVQSFAGAMPPPGDARPAWKVLRVLGNLVDLEGFEQADSGEVRDALLAARGEIRPDNRLGTGGALEVRFQPEGIQRIGGVPLYSVDALTRRSAPLQATPDAWDGCLRLNERLAADLSLADGDKVRLTQGEASVELPVKIDDCVADRCVWLPVGVPEAAGLGCGFAEVGVEKA